MSTFHLNANNFPFQHDYSEMKEERDKVGTEFFVERVYSQLSFSQKVGSGMWGVRESYSVKLGLGSYLSYLVTY